jgi:hypothetical protein
MNGPQVSVIILNWNGLEDTVECLESLRKISYPNYEVIVVDNGSKGNDADILENKYRDYIRVIRNDENYGFAEGNNIAIRWLLENSKSDYYLLLNNDTVVAPDFLHELVRIAENDDGIGIVGPKIRYYDFNGKTNVIWSAGGKICRWSPQIYKDIGLKEEDLSQYQAVSEVAWVSGAALMLNCRIIDELSLFDSEYFFGHEDVDYCLRARRCGFKVVYVPNSIVWHKVGSSRKRIGYKPVLRPLLLYYRLIKHNFSLAIYIYQVCMLPVILCQRATAYLIKYRDKETLLVFLADLKRFVFVRLRGKSNQFL